MGVFMRVERGVQLLTGFLLVGLVFLTGCQMQAISARQLTRHQRTIDHNGMLPVAPDEAVHVTWAVPEKWQPLPTSRTFLYTHQQYRAPSCNAGVGVAYVHTPIPLSADMLIWVAKNEYTKRESGSKQGGKLVGEWSDSLGRHWFEAANARYHVKGYAMTHGTDAWIVYSGYRVNSKVTQKEIERAQTAADSVVPMIGPDGR